MKRIVLSLVICLLASGVAFGQDPGIQDSIIVQDLEVDNTVETIYAWIYAVTDDSVAFYNIPLTFSATGEGINFLRMDYYPPLINWDETFYDYLEDDGFLRNIGFHDIGGEDNPPLQTNGIRVHIWNVVFEVEPGAEDQYVVIDTTHDPVNGSMILGLVGGTVEITPAFVSGTITFGDPLGVDDELDIVPKTFALEQNYPNPFNPQTTIEFALPTGQNVAIDVYNLLGQHVKTLSNGHFEAGVHSVIWNGTNDNGQDVPSGIYFYSLNTQEFSKTNKMVLIR